MRLVEPNSKLFGLIYGMSGTGKTHLAATYALWHPDRNVLLIDADQGSETLKAKEFEKADNLYVVSFDDFKDFDNYMHSGSGFEDSNVDILEDEIPFM